MIRVTGIHKGFARPVLNGVDLHVPRGCLYGLVGPGASGKSVLLKVLTALLPIDGGEVLIDGRCIHALSTLELHEARKGIGMLFQNNALFDFMTVAENIAFPLQRLFDLPVDEVSRRVEERLTSVGLAGFGGRAPAGLSGGQKKRVGVARATVSRAPVVLYDEPAAGLDPVTSQRIFDLLRREQRASGATVLMVSSDLDRLLTVTDLVGVMVQGRIIFEGTTEAALACREPRVHQFLHGEPDGPL